MSKSDDCASGLHDYCNRCDCECHVLTDFNPDWDLLAATQASLREHMELVKTLKAENERLRKEYSELIREYKIHVGLESKE